MVEDWKGNSLPHRWRNEHVCYKEANYRKHFQIRRNDYRNRPPAKKGALLFTDSEAGCIAGWPQSPQSLQISPLNPGITRRICCVIGLDVTLITVWMHHEVLFQTGGKGKENSGAPKFQFRSLTTTRTNPWKGDLFAPIGKDRLSSNQHFSGVKLAGKNFRVVLVVFWKIWNWKLIFCLMYRAATPISSASTLVFLSEFALFCNLLEMNPCTVTYRVFGMLLLPI